MRCIFLAEFNPKVLEQYFTLELLSHMFNHVAFNFLSVYAQSIYEVVYSQRCTDMGI